MVNGCQGIILVHNFSDEHAKLAYGKTLQVHARRLQTAAQVVDIMQYSLRSTNGF